LKFLSIQTSEISNSFGEVPKSHFLKINPHQIFFVGTPLCDRAACKRTAHRNGHRVASREVVVLPELSKHWSVSSLLPFEDLVAPLSERQRAVLTMIKVNGMSIEEVARATASTIGAIKQDAHRAYEAASQSVRAHTIKAANTPRVASYRRRHSAEAP
jgi:ATP/maltotriose-dependent transcriptional regulator MalT